MAVLTKITQRSLADNAVTSAHVQLDGLAATDIAAGAVGSSELADDAVGADQLAADAVVDASVASSAAIGLSKLATTGTLTATNIIGNPKATNATTVAATYANEQERVHGTVFTTTGSTVTGDVVFESLTDETVTLSGTGTITGSGGKIIMKGLDSSGYATKADLAKVTNQIKVDSLGSISLNDVNFVSGTISPNVNQILPRDQGISLASVSNSSVQVNFDYLTVYDSNNNGKVLTDGNYTWAVSTNGLLGRAPNETYAGEAAGRWYYLYVIHNGLETSVVSSIRLPNDTIKISLPTGYTHKRLIGAAFNNSGSNITFFRQSGEWVNVLRTRYQYEIAGTTVDNMGSPNLIIPPTAVAINYETIIDTAAGNVDFNSYVTYDFAQSQVAHYPKTYDSTSSRRILTGGSGQIYFHRAGTIGSTTNRAGLPKQDLFGQAGSGGGTLALYITAYKHDLGLG